MQILRDGGRTGRYCGRASAAARFLCTVLVTTVHLSQFETLRSLRNSLVASVVRGLQRFVLPKTTIPAFSFCPVCFRTLETTETTKSFSERACAAIPKGRRECVGVADKSLVRSGSEGSEAPPLPTKPFLTFGGAMNNVHVVLFDVFLLVIFHTFCAFVVFLAYLHRCVGLPVWVVNLPRRFIPDALMRAAAYSYIRREEAKKLGGVK